MSTTPPREESEMTTNQERAHALISSAIDTLALDPTAPWFERELPKVAQALADAGLLMPDLPEPHGLSGRLKFWDHEMHSVTIHPHFGLRLIAEQSDTELTPAEARLIANSLYSAANYAEQEHTDV